MEATTIPAREQHFRTFGEILRDLLIDRGMTTAIGNPNWSEFARDLANVHYETLRKAVTGDRRPNLELMESCAGALGVDPTVFPEYALQLAQREFDPTVVGSELAMKNLELWTKTQRKR